MVENKKKVVSGVVAATALTGAFIAPETAQAADNDNQSSNQQQTTKEQSSGNLATQKVDSTKATLDNLQAEAKKAINTAKNIRNTAKTKLELAITAEETAKDGWQTNFDNSTKKAQKSEEKQKEGKNNRAKKLREEAEELMVKAEGYRQDYQVAKLQVSQEEGNLQKAENNLITVTTEQNKIVEAAQADYDRALMQQRQAIQGATKSRSDDNWGNWTKQHTVEDYLTDDSGFQALIPQFQKLVQQERKQIPLHEVKAKRLDANRLFLKHDHNVRVHFINEGAGYRNQLAYEATKGDDYHKGMIFDDIGCRSSDCELVNGGDLDIGDFVELGLIEGGTQLNFLLKANGKNNSNGRVYGADESLNGDSLQHLMAFEVQAGGRDYLLMGFEDLWGGGDKDYNDAMFVVDFGEGNLTNTSKKTFTKAATVPEASNMAAILGVTAAGLMSRRRRRHKK